MSTFSTFEDKYDQNFCLQLEAAYGEGMMAEGGIDGIEHMFDQIPLEGKKALDIGCGLGGVPFYLAKKHGMHVTGLDVNQWVIEEAKKRTPDSLKDKVDFVLSISNDKWPFHEESFDLIYSKGVLTHVKEKEGMFRECYRLLKAGGEFVITDWLSYDNKKWGKKITRLVEEDNLILYPESEAGYLELLKKCGFTIVSVEDDTSLYHRYNLEIVEHLKNSKQAGKYSNCFKAGELKAHIDIYTSIAEALESGGELRVVRFVARK